MTGRRPLAEDLRVARGNRETDARVRALLAECEASRFRTIALAERIIAEGESMRAAAVKRA